MRWIWLDAWLALLLLSVTPPTSAAGFDCSHANSSVERSICNDAELSRLDSQMTQVFAQARVRARSRADDLLRDQHNWLGERDEALMSNGPGFGAMLYQRRIMFLRHVFTAPVTGEPLLAAIVRRLAVQPLGVHVHRSGLDGNGVVFTSATEQVLDPAKALPFDTNPLIRMVDEICSRPSDVTLLLLADLKLGGLYSPGQGGSEDCLEMVLFDWRDRTVHGVPVPETFRLGTQLSLVEFQKHAYALSWNESSVAVADVQDQRLSDSHYTWTAPARVMARYDYRVLPEYMHCAQADCAGLATLARKALERYLRNRDGETLVDHISTDQWVQFEILRRRGKADGDLRELPWAYTPNSYISHGKEYQGFSQFDQFNSSSRFFPVCWHGELLLGRISHASEGYRSSDDWLLAVWRWNGHGFLPVFGMAAPTRRGRFLLAARLPPASLDGKQL